MNLTEKKEIVAAIGRILSKYQNRALLLKKGSLLIPLTYARPFIDKLARELKQDKASVYDGFLICDVCQEDETECSGGSLLKVINDLCRESYGEPLVTHFIGGCFSDACKALAGKDINALSALYLLNGGIDYGLIYKPIWDLTAQKKMLWLDENKTCLLMANEAFAQLDPLVVKKCFSPLVLNGRFVKVLFFADAVQAINLYGKSTRTELNPDKVEVLRSLFAGNKEVMALLENIYEAAMYQEWCAEDFVEVDKQQTVPYQELNVVYYRIGQGWSNNNGWYAVKYKDLSGIVKNIKQFAGKFGCTRISTNGKMLYLTVRAFKYLQKLFITQSWKHGGSVIVDMKSVKSSKICDYDELDAYLNNKQDAA